MSKLDEIRERNERRSRMMKDSQNDFEIKREIELKHLHIFSIRDINEMVFKLETAEKALEDIIFETDVPVSDVSAIKRLSQEALQQLRS